MEDENETKEEDQPSTSKKESPDEDMTDNTRHDERETNSETSGTGSYFARSRVDMADIRSDAPKVPIVNKREREPKTSIRKKRKITRRAGRVEKRQRSFSRREMKRFSRRKPRVRQEIKEDPSVTTIYTRLSSRSDSRVQLCSHCGHRCCRRRVEMIQVGSRSVMFSPLCINTASTLNDLVPEQPTTYSPVSPEMIYESLRKLSVWRQYVMTGDLMDYIRRNYPVNPVESELYPELKEKLRIATIAGIVIEPYEDNWCLACGFKERQLPPNHVSLFWEAFVDTMSPLRTRKLQAKEVDSAGTEDPPAKGNDQQSII